MAAPSSNPTVRTAVQKVRERMGDVAPRVGIILGSGLGSLADAIQTPRAIPYADIPGFPHSSVPGHAGQFVGGSFGNTPVIAMQGRAHLYEGWPIEQAMLPVMTMVEMGIELLIVSNASGGINLRFKSGQIVAIDQHMDCMHRHPRSIDQDSSTLSRLGIPNRTCRPYASSWLEKAENVATQLGFSLPRGTYLATLGPNYETRAEYRAFARMGADMVGMSTVPEVLVASQLGVPTLAFSVVTNVAKPDAQTKTDHSEVLELSQVAQQRLVPLLRVLLETYVAPVPRPFP